MTNEKAISIIKNAFSWYEDNARESEEEDWSGQHEALKMAIQALEQRWIPVSERLPMMGDTFLVTIEYKGEVIGVDAASYSPVEGYIDKHWDTFNDWKEDDDSCYHVTAWMPLPEPYKEDAEC